MHGPSWDNSFGQLIQSVFCSSVNKILLNISFNTRSVPLTVWLSVKLLGFLDIQLSFSPHYIMYVEVSNGIFFQLYFQLNSRCM